MAYGDSAENRDVSYKAIQLERWDGESLKANGSVKRRYAVKFDGCKVRREKFQYNIDL